MPDDPSAPYRRPTYKTRQLTSADATPTRPKLGKEDSNDLLSYYQSPIADEGRNYSRPLSPEKPRTTQPVRKSSTASTSSSSDYSDESEVTDARDVGSVTSSSVTRRSSTLSKGGAAKRRIAIVQMDTVGERTRKYNSDISSPNSIRSRRANGNALTGLALVAPPDASFRSYTQIPTTAPVSGDYMSRTQATIPQDKAHHRSASENPADLDKAMSRDTGGVGVVQGHRTKPFLSNVGPTKNTKPEDKSTYGSSPAHVFHPSTRSRSPSPIKQPNPGDLSRINLSPFDRTPMSARTSTSQILTPAIGESKEIHVPVAGPVVVRLDNLPSRTTQSSASWRSESPTPSYGSASNLGSPYSGISATSSYLRYEPGVHATAGPLPPPPRAVFNIDTTSPPPPRPPRLHSPTPPSASSRRRGELEAVKQALQLPASVNAVLNSKLSNHSLTESVRKHDKQPMQEKLEVKGDPEIREGAEVKKVEVQERQDEAISRKESTDEGLQHSKSIHKREGATLSTSTDSTASEPTSTVTAPFSETSSISSPEDNKSSEEIPADSPNFTPAVTVVPPPRSTTLPPETIDHSKFDKWLQENPQLTHSFDGRRSTSLDERRESLEPPLSPSSEYSTGEAPSPPPKSFRNSLTSNLKRFSALPKTPSPSSKSARRLSESPRHSSRTPSPSSHMFARPAFKKIKTTNPSAMFCHEVHLQTTTLQRCAIYASKINELYMHDSGLSDWVVETKTRGQSNHNPRGPSTQSFTPQPRQTSRSSMISDATFPIRPDASVATDLSGAYRDITPPGVPALPYPSLAMNPPPHTKPTRTASGTGSGTPTSSIRSLAPTPSLKGGFFASLGRKTSMTSARKDKYLPTISAPIPIPNGLASRASSKHSHASMNIPRSAIAATPPSVPGGPRAPPNRAQRSQTYMSSVSPTPGYEDLTRRPSLFSITSDAVIDIRIDPVFEQQVDKLHALLPHAERDVLAGYLRRAGQDMLAIGQYLEDERMGTIHRF